MKLKMLYPDQIVALKDYPLHNQHILKIYFRVFSTKQGRILPPCPVVHRSIAIPYLRGNDKNSKAYNTALERFLKSHLRAQYFLIDGNHKSIAATLAGESIPTLVLENDKDIRKANRMIESDELFGAVWFGDSMREAVDILAKHFKKYFSRKPAFYTVAEKARLLVKRRAVPKHMVSMNSQTKD